MQRDNLEIANLEVRTASLEAQVSQLERRKEEVKAQLSQEITGLVLDYEKYTRREARVVEQISLQQTRQQVLEVGYRLGEGSTTQMLGVWEKQERLQEQLTNIAANQDETKGKILGLVYGTIYQGGDSAISTGDSSSDRDTSPAEEPEYQNLEY